MSEPTQQPVDAQQVDPEHARAELAGETPPHADAEEMETALRIGGPLASSDDEDQRRRQPTEPGPGTSLN